VTFGKLNNHHCSPSSANTFATEKKPSNGKKTKKERKAKFKAQAQMLKERNNKRRRANKMKTNYKLPSSKPSSKNIVDQTFGWPAYFGHKTCSQTCQCCQTVSPWQTNYP
jgi:hypothetical protein